MKKEIIISRAEKTASEIYWNEKHLKEIAYIHEGEWNKKTITNQSDFDKEIEKNKKLYEKLRKYRDEILYITKINKEITKEEYKIINNKIKAIQEGAYKEK